MKIGNQRSEIINFKFRSPKSAGPIHLRPCGFTYVALLAAIVIIGISLGAAAKYWSNVALREKEEELLFRGDQYRKAVERYYLAVPGRRELPQSIDDLLRDNRTAIGKRHLRRKFKDPITAEDFVEITDTASKRIRGVRSSSEKEPLKKSNFPEQYKDFEGKERYNEWQFVFLPQGGHSLPPPPPPPGMHIPPMQ